MKVLLCGTYTPLIDKILMKLDKESQEELEGIQDKVVPEPPGTTESGHSLVDYTAGFHRGVKETVEKFGLDPDIFDRPIDSDWAIKGYNAGLIMAARAWVNSEYFSYNPYSDEKKLREDHGVLKAKYILTVEDE